MRTKAGFLSTPRSSSSGDKGVRGDPDRNGTDAASVKGPRMSSRRLTIVFCAAAVALALSACGGGGTVSTGVPNGDDHGISLPDNWQRFKDGNPTLRMTNAQVSEAWRSAARKSTHRVILAGPVSAGKAPGPVTPVTYPSFPADADACSRGSCGFDPRPDSTWAFAPVLEHSDVPVARFNGRFTRTLTLEPERGTDYTQTDLFDSLTFGGWLDHTHFKVTVTRWCAVGEPGCAGLDDPDPVYAGGRVLGYMAGSYSGTAPAGVGSAAWTGVMVGMEDLDTVSLRRERPDVFLGDARIVIDDLAVPDVDVSFTNIHNVTEGTRHRDVRWEDLRIEKGLFGSVSRESGGERYDYLVGMFTGPGHQEVGGEFRGDGIAGAFGAKRQ